jgi:hypothetical protein
VADALSICTPRKMMRSSSNLFSVLFGLDSLTPELVRSMNEGRT